MIDIYTLFSSSSGNCALVRTNNTNILVDAGVSASKICNALSDIGVLPSEIDGIFVTHEHSDHISAIGVLSRKYNIPVYANERTMEQIVISFGDIHESRKKIIETHKPFSLRDIEACSFSIPHDAADPVGYRIRDDESKIAIATDTGCVLDGVLKFMSKCDTVVIESNHDINMLKSGKYPYYLKKRILSDKGHLSNDKAAYVATQLALWGTKKIVLGHLSMHNNTPGLAFSATADMFEKNGINIGKDVVLKVAPKAQTCLV